MANLFELTSRLASTDYVIPSSRYVSSKVGYYGPQKKITFAMYQRKVITEQSTDKYMVVTPGVEYRPDLVSNLVYGTVDYWWAILQANNIADVFDFKNGLTIRLPSAVGLQQV